MRNIANLWNISNLTNSIAVSGGAVVTYATRNPADKHADITLSNWNLTATNTTANRRSVRSNIGKSSGKWYWEYLTSAWTDWHLWIGNSSAALTSFVWFDANWWAYYYNDWNKVTNNSYAAYWTSYNLAATIWVALDMTAWTVIMYRNNVSQWTMYTWLSWTLYPMIGVYGNGTAIVANFWATTMAYSAPAWYNQWLYT